MGFKIARTDSSFPSRQFPDSFVVGGFATLEDGNAYLAGDHAKLLPHAIRVDSPDGPKFTLNPAVHFTLEIVYLPDLVPPIHPL
jgi:hypothetical protein